ncbi:gamma-aminobutyric acid receptor subunit beta-2-like [Orbicella faveolata]|uniref:gamma-aminobutyric acid receptor subunit beta-2-like n=1 Tax=Orbicella faveolata TaxID=48498 RepID=UPI0009E3BC75|nr:gamma-aminobutyric acid receptor subunit beta-2-like [Orbicella faveolata]
MTICGCKPSWTLILCILVALCSSTVYCKPRRSAEDMTALLNKLIKGYDNRLRPNFGGDPVIITVGLWVLSIDSINVVDMDYKLDFFLRQLWTDPRLSHDWNQTLALSNTMLDKIWVPDTYFENSKSSKFHKVTMVNKLLSISPDGGVHYNARVTVRASCPMDLHLFPFDEQHCDLNIESYGYNADNMQYEWENRTDKGVAVNKKLDDMPQYNLTGTSTKRYFTMYYSGNWSRLQSSFSFVRRSGYFLIHIYAPCALIVILSWISFCIPPDATAARIALGITSVLTITTILNMLNTAMPKVSYVKAIDWYLIGSFLFVFGVLVEYTFVLYVVNVHNKRLKRLMIEHEIQEAEEAKASRKPAMNGSVANKNHRESHDYDYDPLESYSAFSDKSKKPSTHLCERSKSRRHGASSDIESRPLTYPRTPQCRVKTSCLNVIDPDCIDDYARILFPVCFVIFNIVYWLRFKLL